MFKLELFFFVVNFRWFAVQILNVWGGGVEDYKSTKPALEPNPDSKYV
jgi:hypothetical protein